MAPKYDTSYFELCTFIAEDHVRAKLKRAQRRRFARQEHAERLEQAKINNPSLARAIDDYARREKIW